MRKLNILITFIVLASVVLPKAYGQNDKPALESRHSVRIGWGDMITETILFRPSLSGTWANPNVLPDNYLHYETFDFGYTGHIFGEYKYRLTKVTSLGIQADVEGIFWRESVFDKDHNMVMPAKGIRNWDLTLLATARFTYFDRKLTRPVPERHGSSDNSRKCMNFDHFRGAGCTKRPQIRQVKQRLQQTGLTLSIRSAEKDGRRLKLKRHRFEQAEILKEQCITIGAMPTRAKAAFRQITKRQ